MVSVGYYLNLSWPHGLWLGQWSIRERREFYRQFFTEEAYWGYLMKLRAPELPMPGLGEHPGVAYAEHTLSVWRMRIRGVRHHRVFRYNRRTS